MMVRAWLCGCALVAGMNVASTSVADVLVVTPIQATILPADGGGRTRVLLQFSLDGLRGGEGRKVDSALIDWGVAGIPTDATSEYEAFVLTSAWTPSLAAGAPPTIDSAAAEVSWELTVSDVDNTGGGGLRFDITTATQEWAEGRRPNYGVMIVTDDLEVLQLAMQLYSPTLTVRYGFVGN